MKTTIFINKLKENFKKIIPVVALTFVATITFATADARTAYQGQDTALFNNPIFNEYYDVPGGVGDESDFVRIKTKEGTNADFKSTLNSVCEEGSEYTVRTYVHNGANPELNENGQGSAVAHDVVVAMQAELGQEKSNFNFKSTISSSNAASVSDSAMLKCGQKIVKLSLVPNSVSVYSKPTGTNTAPDSAVNGSLKIGSRSVGSGDVWGCWEDRVFVRYDVVVEEVEEPTPEFNCTSVTANLIDRKRSAYTFTANATAQNTDIEKYTFTISGDRSEEIVVNTSDKSATTPEVVFEPGNYTIDARVTTSDGTSEDVCRTKLTVDADTSLVCESLTRELIDKNAGIYKFTAKLDIGNDIKVKKYIFNFSDRSEDVVIETDATTATTGNITVGDGPVTVTLSVELENGSVKTDICETTVVTTDVPELPKTGAGGFLGFFGSASALTLGFNYLRSRRELANL